MCGPREVVAPCPDCIDHVQMLAVVCKGLPFPSLPQWHTARLPDKSSRTGRTVRDMTVLYVCLSKMLGTKETNNVSLLQISAYWINHKIYVRG